MNNLVLLCPNCPGIDCKCLEVPFLPPQVLQGLLSQQMGKWSQGVTGWKYDWDGSTLGGVLVSTNRPYNLGNFSYRYVISSGTTTGKKIILIPMVEQNAYVSAKIYDNVASNATVSYYTSKEGCNDALIQISSI